MSIRGITAENVENLSDVEKQWSVKALDYAETHYKLICEVDPKTLKLTRIDDELHREFRRAFPDLNIVILRPEDINANEKIKAEWRNFIMPFESRIANFNFGSLLRLDARKEYDEHNSYFVTRTQFFAIEVARNREGVNEFVYSKYQELKMKKLQNI